MSRELGLVVRPYDDAYEILWDSLASAVVQSHLARYASGEHRLTVDQLTALSGEESRVEIDLDALEIESLIEPLGLKLEDLRLSVRTFSKFMNLSDVVFSEKLTSLTKNPVLIGLSEKSKPDIDPLFAIHTGFQIQVTLTLDIERQLPNNSLAPRLRHSILSDVKFAFVSTSDEGSGLEIRKLNDEVRHSERVPKNTSIYIKRIESPVTTNRLNDAMSVYVDGKLLERMKIRNGSGITKLHVAQIGIAILSDVVLRSSIDLNKQLAESGSTPEFESINRTVTGKLVELLQKKGQVTGHRETSEQLLEELIERPERTLARVQSVWGLQQQALESFEQEEQP